MLQEGVFILKSLYSISEVARYFDISNQTLHYYDRIGLLKPSTTDSRTKYRYYSQQQFNKMFMIKELKRLGFSLDEIMAFERNKNLESLGKVLRKNRKELESRIRELFLIQNRMDFYLEMIALTDRVHRKVECQVRSIPTRYAFYVNANFELSDLGQYVEMLYKAYVKVAKLRIPKDLDNKMVLTMDQSRIMRGQFRYYSGIGLLMPRQLEGTNGFVLAESLYATTKHIGAYDTLPATYKRLCAYIEKNGYSINGHATELSLTNVVHTGDSSEFVTEIQIPVVDAGTREGQ